jgi:hypothetical protein
MRDLFLFLLFFFLKTFCFIFFSVNSKKWISLGLKNGLVSENELVSENGLVSENELVLA